MAAMRFEQVQRFILGKVRFLLEGVGRGFRGEGHL